MELTILMPCLNEAETLAICIEKALSYIARSGIAGEVLVADNGSIDGSQDIARRSGARVVDVAEKGYGCALINGIRAARGRYVIMGDADDSYDFVNLEPFVESLRQGYQLVMGNRFKGGIKPGAMPPLHRYLGNPVLSFIGRLFFRSSCRDFHCGLRGFDREAILGIGLVTPGMEFASEMVVKSIIHKLKVTEVATTLSPDGRSRPPHLRSWRDGWRHLRFMLLYAPSWLFLYPGLFMVLVGLAGNALLLPGPRSIGSIQLDIHTLLYLSAVLVVGVQSILFWIYAQMFAISQKLLPPDPHLERFRNIVTLEVGLIVGGLLLVLGILGAAASLEGWSLDAFGALHPQQTMRLVIPSATAIILAGQLIFGSFFLSVLELRSP